MKTTYRVISAFIALIILLPVVSMQSHAEAGVFEYSINSSDESANALFSIFFMDDDGESIDEQEGVRGHKNAVELSSIEGSAPYLLYISLDQFDEDTYRFVEWKIDGSYSSEETDPDANCLMVFFESKDDMSSIEVSAVFSAIGAAVNCTPRVSSSNADIVITDEALTHLYDSEETSTWKLTVNCIEDFELRYIRKTGSDNYIYSDDGYTVTWEIEADGEEYVAYFGKAVPHIGEVGIYGSPKPGVFTENPVIIRIPWSKGSTIPSGSRAIYADVYYVNNDTEIILGRTVSRENVDIPGGYTNSYGFLLTIDPIPEDLALFTVRAKFGENGEFNYRSFDATVLGVKPSSSMSIQYLDLPGGGMGYYSTTDTGPIVYDMAAFVDALTGLSSTYFATSSGLVKLNADGSYTQISGINGSPVAVGGTNESVLCAVTAAYAGGTESNGKTQYLIWQYDKTADSWNALSDKTYTMSHPFIMEFDNYTFDPVACVIAADSIWLKDAHWNGAEWVANDVSFNSFWKDESSAFAGSADGVYRYENSSWGRVSGTSGTTYVVAGTHAGDSVMLLTADTYEPEHRATNGSANNGVRGGKLLVIENTGAAMVTSVDTAAFIGSDGSSLIGMGINSNGDIFGFQPGRSYNGNTFGAYKGSFVYKLTNGEWINQIIPEFNDAADQANIDAGNYPSDENGVLKSRPDGVRYTLTPAEGMTYFLGLNGAIYADYGTTTITFDSKGGSAVAPITQQICSNISAPVSPTLEGKTFSGWFYDEAFTMEWDAYDAVMPAKDITLYAKWNDAGSTEEQLAWYKQKALAALEKQYKKYSSADYTSENWSALQSAYIDGVSAINAATAGAVHIEDNVTVALNAAIAAMQAVPAKNSGEITVAISMDANTLGLGYILEPTLVTVDKGTPVSVVITDLLNANAAEKYPEVAADGLIEKTPELESRTDLYPWASSGSVVSSFYLSDVYFPEQTGYSIPDAIKAYINDSEFNTADANGKYLSEFDYLTTSGWTYSVGDKTTGKAEFPGVGADGWMLSEGEVVRFQFTLVGYGADLGADNTAWGTSNILTVGDKSALTWKVAELRSQYSDATLKTETVYTDALAVLTDAEATQNAIDAALAALNGLTFTESVTGVSLDQTELSVTVGKTAALTATVEPDNATDKTVTWSSADETVATVADGVVTGVKAGTTTITVTTKDSGKTATCAVTVVDEDIPVSGVTLDKESAELTVGETLALTATVAPSGAADKTVTWSSSDESVATVENGVVTAVKEGTATITVTTTDGGMTASSTVTVKAAPVPVTGVTLDKTTAEVRVGETVTLTAAVAPEDATDKTVTWGSSDVTIARVSDGVVTGVKAGKATITVTTADGEKTASCLVTVTEKQEEPDESQLKYTDALNAVLFYVEDETPTPTVNSVGGEWAVFALNRGGAAKDNWNDRYLANLSKTLDEKNGVLSNSVYTEYSRVILALTSMGVDAGQVTTDKATYDLVKPLLDKDEKGDYMAASQGNNGTAFALLAVDSHDYLPGAEGKALRVGLIASLKAKQQESGAWAISGIGGQSLDTTAAAVYALAPYYLDEAKLAALGGSVTHAEVKAMVDDALAFLSGKQDENGGFGSAEADGWVIIALSTLGRDADKEEQFVKNGKSVLDDLLSYFDKTTGGFRHLADGGVDQMASEQAAYDLVAYDRFKNGKNTLYDMTDVEIASLEEKADKAAAEEVEALIDAIGEVTLESKAKIDAARAAYDALTDEQKALVGNLQTLKDAEAKYQELAEAADQEEIDKAAAKGVDELIDAIGEVTLDSEKAIKAARNAYDALTDEQKKLVEKLADLEAAEAKLEELQPLVTVTFYLQSGKSSEVAEGETKTYTKADEGKALPTASRDEYSFEGWYDASTGGTKYTSVSAALPRELYAQWTSDSSGDSGSGGGGDSDEGKITVTMRLIGAKQAEKDVDLGAEEYMPDYVTWIATTSYKLEEGSSVYDLWLQATGDAGIRSVGAEKNYVSAVFAPSSLGGYELAEFTNGKRSGWMYTINGRHPGFGLKEQELHDGDRVIWHYVNDYSYEVSDWFEADSRWPSLGDGRYYNRWLKAPDRFGGSGGGLGEGAQSSGGSGDGSGGSSEIIPSYDGDTIVIKADVEHSEGGAAYAADATLDKKTVAEGLEKAEDKSSLKVWVDIEDSNRLVLRIEPEAMREIADAKAGLRMECSRGVIKLDADAVAKLTESGHEVRMVVSYDDWNDKTTVSVRPFPPTDGDAAVMLKIELPATKDGQALSIVGSDGTTTPIKKSAIIGDRVYAEVPSGVTLTITESDRYWNDVKAGDWFADAVSFAVSHDLMNGVDRYEFAPNMPMTRAMLVTVLYRLEDEPEIANSMSFGDVASGAWYTEAVAWAAEQEIVRGNGDGFAPNDNITREQIATVLYRYAQYLGMDVEAKGDVSKFSDGEEISSWAQDAMAWAVKVGLFKGDDTGSLNPQGNATRAEVATLLERLIKLIIVS